MTLTDEEVENLVGTLDSLESCKELLIRTLKSLNKTTKNYVDIYREKLILEQKLENVFNALFEEPELTEEGCNE